MPSLRDEVAELMIPPDKASPNYERQAGHYDMAKTILMLIDNRESKPSDERPARDALFAPQGRAPIDYGAAYWSTKAMVGRALVEAIDANTAAVREARKP